LPSNNLGPPWNAGIDEHMNRKYTVIECHDENPTGIEPT
jgi:hypothetical protein